ncbi:MAG: hypothetical protein GYA17_22170 [Chloroflexi bacterium]|nr:hypothetical protein [Anaerolineaceae bacterium]NMB91076.1 hypothetical protein [Chloroflexota bacterium]
MIHIEEDKKSEGRRIIMKKVLGLLLLILALAVAVSAYNNAKVVNAGTMAIVNSDQALLTLRACEGVGNLDQAVYYSNGELKFDFRRGIAKYGLVGFQPNSEYIWQCAFEIHNKSSERLQVAIDGDLFPYMDLGAVDRCPGNWWCGLGYKYFASSGAPTGQTAILPPDYILPVSIRFNIDANATLGSLSGEIVVRAEALP